MKDYTIIYKCNVSDKMQYSIKAKNLQHAKEIAPKIINGDIQIVVETIMKDGIVAHKVESVLDIPKVLHPGENYKTKEGWVVLNGEFVFFHKHWSYSGGYPYFSDDKLTQKLGEVKYGN